MNTYPEWLRARDAATGNNPLHYAMSQTQNTTIVEMLIRCYPEGLSFSLFIDLYIRVEVWRKEE